MSRGIIDILIGKGVKIPAPRATCISEDVDPERIAGGVTIYPGCRISGAKTFIESDAGLGAEGPATIEDCAIGKGVELKGGYFKGSVFLDASNMGLGAHVREASILEEEANAAHTVGLKQTILFPFVTLGSLINFCDCLMAGGTNRKDHSEVGSSYIHFNFTPNQDKATASLLGDVPKGVFLRERPIFLGGQGGIVGPSRIGFGTVIAAGTVFRGDLGDGMLHTGGSYSGRVQPFIPGVYTDIRRKVGNNIHYIANLIALKAWYKNVRSLFLHEAILSAAVDCLEKAIDERISRLGVLAGKMPESIKGLEGSSVGDRDALVGQQREFHAKWPEIEDKMRKMRDFQGDPEIMDRFLSVIPSGGGYIETIQGLDEGTVRKGMSWLVSIIKKEDGYGIVSK